MQPATPGGPAHLDESPKRPWQRVAVVAIAAVAVLGGLYYLGFFGNGSARLLVHDAPCSVCSHVWVTFTAISLHESDVKGSGWVDLNVSGTTVDLEVLNGTAAAKLLGIASLSAGHYQQLRVEVSKVVVDLLAGGQLQATVEGPSSNFDSQFTIGTGGTTTLNIDIDLSASLHLTPGAFGSMTAAFTPNIGAVEVSGS